MKLLKLVFCFTILFTTATAQGYEKVLNNEISYDAKNNELVFKHLNTADTTLFIPSFTTLSNYYVVTYPSGASFPVTNVGVETGKTPIESKKEFTLRQGLNALLELIKEETDFSDPKRKHLIPESGTYKIEWFIIGLPTQKISLEYKL